MKHIISYLKITRLLQTMTHTLLEAYISSSTNVNNKYTLYEIIVVSNIAPHKPYFTIHKRYSDFVKLHSKLKKHVKELPAFPEKRFYKLNQEIIYERTCKFNFYIKYLCMLVTNKEMSEEGKKIVINFIS